MAKFNLGINLGDAGVAEGREAWSGELPPTGSYLGKLKVMSMGEIGPEAKNAGKPKVSIGVELKAEKGSPSQKYDGFIAWGNLNLIEESAPYINQFLMALTDGEEASLIKIQHAFSNDIDLDERKKHIIRIGNLKVDSPEGELPIKVSLINTPFHNKKTNVTTQQVRISSYLVNEGNAAFNGIGSSGPAVSDIVEEETLSVDLEPEDEETYEEPEENSESEEDSGEAENEEVIEGEVVDADNLL